MGQRWRVCKLYSRFYIYSSFFNLSRFYGQVKGSLIQVIGSHSRNLPHSSFCVYSSSCSIQGFVLFKFLLYSRFYRLFRLLRLFKLFTPIKDIEYMRPPALIRNQERRAFDTRVPASLLFRSYLKTWPFPSYLKIRNIYLSSNYLCNFISFNNQLLVTIIFLIFRYINN